MDGHFFRPCGCHLGGRTDGSDSVPAILSLFAPSQGKYSQNFTVFYHYVIINLQETFGAVTRPNGCKQSFDL